MILRLLASATLLAAGPALAQTRTDAEGGQEDGAERIAVIGVLDKRVGETEEFTLRPGESFDFRRLHGVLQTCDHSAPWERKQSAAFVQVTETPRPRTRGEDVRPRTIFSGWLFAESPSLNPVSHPVYDVWLKSCTIVRPEGPKRSGTGSDSKASAGSPSGREQSTETSGAATD